MGMGKKKKKHKKKDKHGGDKDENEGGEQQDAGGEPKEEGQDKGSDHGAEDKEAKPAEGEGAPEEAAPEAAPAEGGKEESKPEGKAADTASDTGSAEKAEGAGDKASDVGAAAAPEKKSKKKKKKSFSKELRDGNRYSGKVPPLHNYTLDFTCLTAEEEKMLRTVVERDEAEMKPTMEFVKLLSHEMDLLRYRGMGVEGQKPKCLRCRKKYALWRKLIPFIDQGKRCMICQFKACPGCRYKQANGKYLCGICVRRREIKMLTGEWLEPPATRLHSTDLIKVSLRDKDKYHLLHAAREKKKNDLLQKLNALHSRRKSQNVALGGFNLWKSAKKGKKSKKKKKDKKEKKDKEKKKKSKKKKKKEKSNNATSELVDLDTNMSFLSSAIRCVEGESFSSRCETSSVLSEDDEEETSQSNASSGTCTVTETASKQRPSRKNKKRVSIAVDEEVVTEDADEEEYDENDYDEDLYKTKREEFYDNEEEEEEEEEYDLDDRYYNDGSEGYSGDNCFPEGGGGGEYEDYYYYYEGEGYSEHYNYNDDDDYYDDANKEDYCCSENKDNQTHGKSSDGGEKRQTTKGEAIEKAESRAAGIRSKEKLDVEMKSDQLCFEQDKERTDHRKGKDQGTNENRRLKRKHKESYHGGSYHKREGEANSDAPSMKVCRAAQQGTKVCWAAQQGSTDSIQKQTEPTAGRDNVSQGPGEGRPGERHQSHPTERKEKYFLNHQHREYMKSRSKKEVEKHDSDTYILETGCFDLKNRKDISISRDQRVKSPALKICGDGKKHSRMSSSTKLAFEGKEQEMGTENPMANPKQMASKPENGKLGSKRHRSSSLAKEKGEMASTIEHLKTGEEKRSASKSSAKKKKTDHHSRAHNEEKPSSVPAGDGPGFHRGSAKGQQQPKMPSLFQELYGLAEIDNTRGDYFLPKSNPPRSLAPSSRPKAFCLAKSDDAWLNRNTRALSTTGSTIGSNSGTLWSEGNKFQEYTHKGSVKSKYLSSAKRASQKRLGLFKKAILNAQRSSSPQFSKLVSAKT